MESRTEKEDVKQEIAPAHEGHSLILKLTFILCYSTYTALGDE